MRLTSYKVKEVKYNEDENSWDIEWVSLSNKNNTWLWCSVPENELPDDIKGKITKTKLKKLKLTVKIECQL